MSPSAQQTAASPPAATGPPRGRRRVRARGADFAVLALFVLPLFATLFVARGQGRPVAPAPGPKSGTARANVTDYRTHFLRGLALSKRGGADAAVEEFTLAIEASPHFRDAYYQRGIALVGPSGAEKRYAT